MGLRPTNGRESSRAMAALKTNDLGRDFRRSAAKNLSSIQLIEKIKEGFFATLRMTCELTSDAMYREVS